MVSVYHPDRCPTMRVVYENICLFPLRAAMERGKRRRGRKTGRAASLSKNQYLGGTHARYWVRPRRVSPPGRRRKKCRLFFSGLRLEKNTSQPANVRAKRVRQGELRRRRKRRSPGGHLLAQMRAFERKAVDFIDSLKRPCAFPADGGKTECAASQPDPGTPAPPPRRGHGCAPA